MRVAMAIAAGLLFLGCQNYSENPLATDLQSIVRCPANGCSSKNPSVEEMKLYSSSTYYSPMIDPAVQISGSCYASKFPSNIIEISVLNSNRQSLGPLGVSLKGQSSTSCDKGRFNFVVNVSSLPADTYYVRLAMRGLDDKNISHDSAQGPLEIRIIRQ